MHAADAHVSLSTGAPAEEEARAAGLRHIVHIERCHTATHPGDCLAALVGGVLTATREPKPSATTDTFLIQNKQASDELRSVFMQRLEKLSLCSSPIRVPESQSSLAPATYTCNPQISIYHLLLSPQAASD